MKKKNQEHSKSLSEILLESGEDLNIVYVTADDVERIDKEPMPLPKKETKKEKIVFTAFTGEDEETHELSNGGIIVTMDLDLTNKRSKR